MNTEERDIEWIEQFLEGKLNKEEEDRFRARLSESPEFSHLYEDMRIMFEGIRTGARKKLLDDLKNLDDKILEREESRTNRFIPLLRNKYLWMTAAAVVLLAVLIPGIFTNEQEVTQLVYKEHFKPYPNLYHVKQRADTLMNTETDQAFEYYDGALYEQAIPLLKELSKQDTTGEISFYLAISYMAEDHITEAMSLLEQPHSAFSLQTKWYLSLCYIKSGDKKSAEILLSEIVKNNNSYSEKATEILQTLN